mgnify:CR=1 FL=1
METFINSILGETKKNIIRNENCSEEERNKKRSLRRKVKTFFSKDHINNFKNSVPANHYAYAKKEMAKDHQNIIDIEKENRPVSRVLLALREEEISDHILMIIPGHASSSQKSDIALDETSLERLEIAYKIFKRDHYAAILVSGGNVHPKDTPHNEAYEMKKVLMKKYGIPEYRIAIEPYARNSITNLRNAGRFMIRHGIEKSLIVTTKAQNYYYAFNEISFLDTRSEELLGYKLGGFKLLEKNATEYKVSQSVLSAGTDPLDP